MEGQSKILEKCKSRPRSSTVMRTVARHGLQRDCLCVKLSIFLLSLFACGILRYIDTMGVDPISGYRAFTRVTIRR